MSIIARLVQLTPDQTERFAESPAEAYKFILGRAAETNAQTSKELDDWKRRNALILMKTITAGGPENMDAESRMAFDRVHKEFTEIAHRKVHEAMAGFMEGKKIRRKQVGISLEKAWHGIHFLLTGEAEGGKPPLVWAILGDQEVPDSQKVMGYGAARLLMPRQVLDVNSALAKVKQKELRLRFDVEAMYEAKIYATKGEIDFEYFWAYLLVLKGYYAQAAKFSKGMLCYFE